MFRSRSWFGGGWNKPKNRLSLEHLKYLHSVLEKNTSVSESNRGLLVESLRCIAEILIWGDQNDSSVFDFFLEKNMLSYFLHIMRQKSGGPSFVCVQLLQTLNILFENIRNETSLYYLLSNNHVNSIIVHKFDFSDEDVMGYYILFLKTLSLKLNIHTIHFFYNEHTNDFPLYTEAIKFFNHPESMVRIAVRTISLNVYKVQNPSMLQFIRDKTAAPYFSNLVWFIGKHILELDNCVRNDTEYVPKSISPTNTQTKHNLISKPTSSHQSQHRLANLVAEHLDHLHYLNDILYLDIADLNAVLTEHLLHKLFIPLYIFSLTPAPPLSMALITQNLAAVLNKVVNIDMQELNNPRVSSVVALFLLSLVFLVITHGPLVHALAWVILNADHNVFKEGAAEVLNAYIERRQVVTLGFGEPDESLEEALDGAAAAGSHTESQPSVASSRRPRTRTLSEEVENVNITDEEKEKLRRRSDSSTGSQRPFLDMVLSSLECSENDYLALLALCLFYALANNKGVDAEWLNKVLNKTNPNNIKYKTILIDKLLQIVSLSSQPSCRIRLVTLDLAMKMLCQLTCAGTSECSITDSQRYVLIDANTQGLTVLRNFYKSEDIFLDLFEDEYSEMTKSNLNVEFLCMDSTILLPPTGTPLTGIGFTRRLPCGEVEKARRAIRVFFLLRKMTHAISGSQENLLPLTNTATTVSIDNVLDLNNSDLIACTVLLKDGTKYRRFLVIDVVQLILVEPDSKRLGWGVTKFVGFLQDVEVAGDKDDSRCLHITIHRGGATTNRTPILSAKFVFDDHIRCMAAKQRLTKGRSKARQKKMLQIAQLLELPGPSIDGVNYSMYMLTPQHLRSQGSSTRLPREHRPLFSTANRVPGVAAALRRDSMPTGSVSRAQMNAGRSTDHDTVEQLRRKRDASAHSSISGKSRDPSRTRMTASRSRESSPRMPRPRSEEIPLEDFRQSRNSSPASRCSSNTPSRAHTPSRLGADSTNVSPRDLTSGSSSSSSSSATSSKDGSASAVSPSSNSEETSFIAQKKKGDVETV